MDSQSASQFTTGPGNIPPPDEDFPDAGSIAIEDDDTLYEEDDTPMDEEDNYGDEADANDLAEVDDGSEEEFHIEEPDELENEP